MTGLSVLSRGSLEEKLRWTFSLYDINGDGCITKEEMTDIVTAIYDLMGRVSDPLVEDDIVQQKVERLFQVCQCFFCYNLANVRGVKHVLSVMKSVVS